MESSPGAEQLSTTQGQTSDSESGPGPSPRPLACVACRRRKVKCDHKVPVCGNCEKYGLDCTWPEGRRPSSRRQRPLYQHVVSRLAQMERLVEELQTTRTSPRDTMGNPTVVAMSMSTDPAVDTNSSDFSPSSGNIPQSQYHSTPSVGSPGVKPFYSGSATEASIGTTGTCSLLSPEGIHKINCLVGDCRFSDFVRGIQQNRRNITPRIFLGPSETNHPFPPNNNIMESVNDFFLTQNHDLRLFQEHEVRTAVQAYIYGQPPSEPGWRMALNIILAHSIRKKNRMHNAHEYEKYIHNALGMIPSAILHPPSPLIIGALLSMVFYFTFTGDNHIAVTLLGLTVQPILLAGYHRTGSHHGLSDVDILHRRRLFWQAYVIDHDLMLRIGKPPLIGDDFLLDLPEEHPIDGYSMFYYPNNVSLNFFRQQVRLSQIQGHICSRLYSKTGGAPLSELEAEISHLDTELQEWRDSIPEMIRPEPVDALLDADYSRMMSLTTLHFVYFQLVVAIHSAAFRLPILDLDAESNASPSVALCVGASRGAISLLKYHKSEHPFTTYLLYQVAWSVDILFVSILQNKTSPRSVQDLELIRTVVSFFEKYDPLHKTVVSYHITKAIAEIASSVLQNTLSAAPQSSVGASAAIPGQGNVDGGVLGSLTGLSVSESGTADISGFHLGNDDRLNTGFLEMADWCLPMDDLPELWQYEYLDAQDPDIS